MSTLVEIYCGSVLLFIVATFVDVVRCRLKYWRTGCISYYENGKVRYEKYYLDGKQYSQEEYTKILQEVRELDIANKLLDPRKWVRELGKREVKVG